MKPNQLVRCVDDRYTLSSAQERTEIKFGEIYRVVRHETPTDESSRVQLARLVDGRVIRNGAGTPWFRHTRVAPLSDAKP
jgi:hypothetical protein